LTLRQARLPVRQIGSGGNERSRAGSVHRVYKSLTLCQ
jgi:hypothetical protein